MFEDFQGSDIFLEGTPGFYTDQFDAHDRWDLVNALDEDPQHDDTDFLGDVILIDEGNSVN